MIKKKCEMKDDRDLFLELFNEMVKKPVLENPRLPYQK